MPQINRIRVNNVKYNFGTQYYDDFLMRFSCKNTIYDLANGGGKSVLMLLLLQNLIPNCTLDEKQPVEKLFRTGNGSNTIHSLVEWTLDKDNRENNFKYMTTGFCARKSREEEDGTEGANIDYFNYVIFYREFNDNDIKNLPLSNDVEKITYNGLKSYLRELEKKDFSLVVKIFEKKGEYQKFISKYGLFESQWEIIRGINKTEGHVRTYFENNYKTTRKVVEDLLIEEIIEKSFNSLGDESMAETLLEIKDKLLELSKKKDDIKSYDYMISGIENFINRLSNIGNLYLKKEELYKEVIKADSSLLFFMQKNDEEKALILKEEEELKTLIEEAIKIIEAAKIEENLIELKGLEGEVYEVDKSINSLKDEIKSEMENLVSKESENDFLDYIYYKKERDIIKEELSSKSLGKEEIYEELKKISSTMEKRIDARKTEIQTSIEEENNALKEEEEIVKRILNTEKNIIRENSVNEYLLNEYKNEIQRLNDLIKKYRMEENLLMSYDIRVEYEKLSRKQMELIELLQKEEFEEKETQTMLLDLTNKTEKEDQKLRETEDEILNIIQRRNSNNALRDRYLKTTQVYLEKDEEKLIKIISTKYKEIIEETKSLKDSMEAQKNYRENLVKGCPVVETFEMKEVLSYIEKYHGDIAISGNDYILGLEKEELDKILTEVPFLPYSIIVKGDFHNLTEDQGLSKILKKDYAIPIIREDALKSLEYIMDASSMFFVMKDISLFKNEAALLDESYKVGENIRDLTLKLEKMLQNEEGVKSDYDFIKEYIDVYNNEIKKDEEYYEKLKSQKAELESSIQRDRETITELKKSLLSSNLLKYSDEIKATEITLKKIMDIIDANDLLSEYEEKIKEINVKLEKSSKEDVNSKEKIKSYENRIEKRKEEISIKKSILKELNDKWNLIYAHYFDKECTEIIEDLSDDLLEAKFKALDNSVKKDRGELEDKQKLLDNYHIAMEKAMLAIDYKGIDYKEIEKRYAMNLLKETSKEELLKIKKRVDILKEELSENENMAKIIISKRDRLIGGINQGKIIFEEKYGEYSEVLLNGNTPKELISIYENEKEILSEKYKKIDILIRNIEKTQTSYAILKRDMDKILNTLEISRDEIKSYFGEEEIEDKILEISEKLEKFKKEEEDKKAEFEKDKKNLLDILGSLNSFELAEDIEKNALMPRSKEETKELIISLEEINKCIALEKERIEKGISDMEKIRENFENQCIQCCINIKSELEKLSRLSKIYLDGENISVIGLNIPYVKEESYKERMSLYIKNIVEMSDGISNTNDKIKHIKNHLSWKRLFSVIVTDMDMIKLTLYKRERIKEQSRHLRYEEAVGSTGQSQGIYIQFLIGIINYITSINSGNPDSHSLSKVIFIDNPFGAAKDIYIWEPIFKLLKTNNVQLIVPCRGATPAITGRFDVNYVLGQKMLDGKQNTVVVDYYSNIEKDRLEYTKLSYAQEEMNFN